MMTRISEELMRVVDEAASYLKSIDQEIAKQKPVPGKWSIQEILGHLIDSASNNHQRFVRAQEVSVLELPGYHQEHWVSSQGYNAHGWHELVELWRLYNRHLARVIARIPADKAAVECRIGSYEPSTLQHVAEDYVVHLKHHLKQIEERRAD